MKIPTVCAALARSAQLFLEETVLEVAHHFQAQTGADSLCVAGGVFLNVLLVRALETRSTFDQSTFSPSPATPEPLWAPLFSPAKNSPENPAAPR